MIKYPLKFSVSNRILSCSSMDRYFSFSSMDRYFRINFQRFYCGDLYNNDDELKADVKKVHYDKGNIIDSFLTKFLDGIKAENHHNDESKNKRYYNDVLNILINFKDRDNDDELRKLQLRIEELTTQYDDLKTIYQLTPDLIKRLISPDKESAKDFIKSHIDNKLFEEDQLLLNLFDHYTLEVIMIVVLSAVFHSLQESPAVRVSTLVEYLTLYYRNHARLLKDRNVNLSPKDDEPIGINTKITNTNSYKIGALLVEFLSTREVITLTNDLNTVEQYVTHKKKGKYYYPKSLFAVCNFDLDLLPIKLNLPMVYPPRAWKPKIEGKLKSMGDVCGGYLSTPTNDLYVNRFNLLTSRDIDHFTIVFEKEGTKLLDSINGLQSQAFEINSDVLRFININYDELVQSRLLQPKFLASLNVSKAILQLRDAYIADKSLTGVCKFEEILHEFMSRVQHSRYESFVINLASAYEGYKFYLPAFLDFRGRIYRAGVLHFHERDLARSLIVFSNISNKCVSKDDRSVLNAMIGAAAGFNFKKFTTNLSALDWIFKQRIIIDNGNGKITTTNDDSIIKFAVDASNPFLFMSKVISFRDDCVIGVDQLPISQDASASAYQIMSIFLLDKKMAEQTNLMYSDQIQDIYTYFLDELKDYLVSDFCSLNPSLVNIINERLTRKLIKKLFMPLIYGKSVLSMANDIHCHYNTILSKKECMVLASDINRFFQERFPGIVNLMELVRLIGWVSSNKDKPVFYSTPFLTTVQDYMKSNPVNISVYDRILKKRRQVTLRIPDDKRDRKKTMTATFANFIHQQDAHIAMCMVLKMIDMDIPIYTVHDNFITSGKNVTKISSIYINALVEILVNPLILINLFITRNLLDGKTVPHSFDRPLPNDYLHKILDERIPKKISSTKKKQWEMRNKSILIAYEKYAYPLCKHNDEIYNGHLERIEDHYNYKCEDFKSCMKEGTYPYALHL